LEPVARYYGRADRVEDVAPAVHELMWKLRRERPGAAALEVPNAVLSAQGGVDAGAGFEVPTVPAPDGPRLLEIARALSSARRPVIVAGAPAADAPAALVGLAEALRAPAFVDGRSKGAIPDDHPLAL